MLLLCPEELRRLLTHNELQIRAIQTLWEQHLQEALKDWEQQYTTITQVHMHTHTHTRPFLTPPPPSLSMSLSLSQERRMMQMHPYILNINEDTQLSGVVKLFIQEGESLNCPRLQLYDRMNIHTLNQDFGNSVCVCVCVL